MHRISYRLTILLGLLAGLALGSPAQASVLNGKYIQACGGANVAQVDPLVSPGQVSDHKHSEQGGRAWSSTSKTGDLLAGTTTCFLGANKSAYWVPTFVSSDGTHVGASMNTYYGAFGKDTRGIAGGKIQPFPPGLRMIVGNPASTVIQSTNVQSWRCNNGTTTYSAPPVTCAGSVQGEMTFPSCWDGMNLDSANHKSHMAKPTTVTGTDGARVRGCPASHPVAVPELQAGWSYQRPAVGWEGSFLSSDHGIGPRTRSFHADLWEAQDGLVQAELTKCLNDPTALLNISSCGSFKLAASPWLAPLNAWANEVSSVKPDGNPGTLPAP